MVTFNYKWDDFYRWSQAVCADFNFKNAVMATDGATVPGWVQQLLQRQILLEDSIRKLAQENEELKSEIHENDLMQRDNANNNMCSTHHSSPRKKDPSNQMILLINYLECHKVNQLPTSLHGL